MAHYSNEDKWLSIQMAKGNARGAKSYTTSALMEVGGDEAVQAQLQEAQGHINTAVTILEGLLPDSEFVWDE